MFYFAEAALILLAIVAFGWGMACLIVPR
jgi:hypothetical protein